MCHNFTVALRVALVLLWIEYGIGRLRRLVDRLPEMSSTRRTAATEHELFDRRDLRARW